MRRSETFLNNIATGEELLRTIGSGPSRRNVAVIVWQIRDPLGQDFEYAKEIARGGHKKIWSPDLNQR